MQNYMLQGTQGSYESSRADGDPGRIWLSSLSSEPKWFDPNALMADESMGGRALPPRWWRPSEQALRAGHGGGDYFVLEDFLAACRGERPVPIGILEAMDMTLPGLVSQQSVLEGGRFIAVPDARAWAKGEAPRPQLEMVLSERALENPPPLTVPPGYVLRQFEERDAESYLALLELSGLAKWDRASLESFRRTRLPGGFFVVEHCATGAIAATAMASHSPNAHHPNGGCIDWVAAHPEHKGKALGAVASIAAVRRLIEVGYRRIYLLTDDFRIPAIKTYLRMGYEPFIWDDAMQARWDAIRRAVN
jgi:mycothiol synthase